MTGPSAEAFPAGFQGIEFRYGGITRDVLRRPPAGPPVILIHEAGGLNARTIEVADQLSRAGLSPVLPVLIDKPRPTTSPVQLGRNFVGICMAAEFAAFAHNRPTPIVTWLKALARHEHLRAGGPGVGVVGMCFSGGFALATVTELAVKAAVASQPSLPFPIPGRRTDLGMSTDELERVVNRAEGGFCVRTLRYQRDYKSPGARMRFIAEMLPNASVVEIPTSNPNRHSVLFDATRAPVESDLGRALAGTIAYLVERLR